MLSLSVATGTSSSVKDTRSLSGGERSFCTLAFTQSLALLVDTPFRAVDEADVFMDAATRKISYDIMFTANEYVSSAAAEKCVYISELKHAWMDADLAQVSIGFTLSVVAS